jgi:hypothetical protein
MWRSTMYLNKRILICPILYAEGTCCQNESQAAPSVVVRGLRVAGHEFPPKRTISGKLLSGKVQYRYTVKTLSRAPF